MTAFEIILILGCVALFILLILVFRGQMETDP